MYAVTIDEDKNRMILELKGFLHDDEVMEFATDAKQAMNKLRPNFDIITDISEFSPATPNGRELIKEAQGYAFKMKVGRVVRVTGNIIAEIQFDRSSKEAGYKALTCKSVQEAKNYLDGKL